MRSDDRLRKRVLCISGNGNEHHTARDSKRHRSRAGRIGHPAGGGRVCAFVVERIRQWQLKAEMLRLHALIMTETAWTPERIALAEEFWATRERLDRGVYGLGAVSHILNSRYSRLPWHDSWAEHVAATVHRAQDAM